MKIESDYVIGMHRQKRNRRRFGVREMRNVLPHGMGRKTSNLSRDLMHAVDSMPEQNNSSSLTVISTVEENTADFDFRAVENLKRKKQDIF